MKCKRKKKSPHYYEICLAIILFWKLCEEGKFIWQLRHSKVRLFLKLLNGDERLKTILHRWSEVETIIPGSVHLRFRNQGAHWASREFDECDGDIERLDEITPLKRAVTWTTWGSKLDTIFTPVMYSLPALKGLQVREH